MSLIPRLLSLAVLLPLAAQAAEPLEKPSVKLTLDWTVSSTHTAFIAAEVHGFFKDEGLAVQIDRGSGSVGAVTNTASGAYDFGWGDIPTLIKFDAQNPDRPLTVVYVSFDESPLVIVALKSSGIKTLKDLEGRKVGATQGSAGMTIFPVVAGKAGIDASKVQWTLVNPSLREAMVVREEVAALAGFTTSSIPSLYDLGKKPDEVIALKYADYGLDLYGTGLWVTRAFAEANPKTVTAMVRALNRGTKAMIAAPTAEMALVMKRDPLLVESTERARLEITLGHHLTPYVRANGLSTVDRARMQRGIASVVEAEALKSTPTVDMVWTDRFLPPASERVVPQQGS